VGMKVDTRVDPGATIVLRRGDLEVLAA
jgi:hypothetical protein